MLGTDQKTSLPNQPELPSKIYAEAVVRSVTGASLLHHLAPVTSENITQFYAEPNLVELAVKRLKAAGFEILEVGRALISIAGAPEVYERAFQATLEAVERPVIREMGEPTIGTLINCVDSKPFGEIDTSNTIWDDLLDGIAINEPVYYTRPTTPATEPPQKTAKYLNVPEDVAQGLNATQAHQNGTTGKGVKVVMIDSGWYPHPFFRRHNYKVDVVLAPGSTAPERDDSGHGTGESANIFAIAPEAELIMIKFGVAAEDEITNVNSLAAFKQAIALRPDIISCSWGSDQRNRQLSPQDKLLAAAVARAVWEGIVVIFAAGNGSWGFPAQHPNAIAVGGVYKHLEGSLKGLLEASNYASSFVSPIYPGRQVPDVCGLVGRLPYGAYIMLPVPPGSLVDQGRSTSGDGTLPSDGWAVFSGTSAAAPQIAGICALLKQVNPNLSPACVKQILQQTAIDVTEGSSNPSTGGSRASPGVDLATGYGLGDANKAVQTTKITIKKTHNTPSFFQTYKLLELPKETEHMNIKLLKARLDEIQVKLDEFLKKEFIDQELIEDVELQIDLSNFVPRSSESRAISSLRKLLINLPKKDGEEFDVEAIKKKHVIAAESLIRIHKFQELATKVLIAAVESTKIQVSEQAAKALGELGVTNFYNTHVSFTDPIHEDFLFFADYQGPNGSCFTNRNNQIRFRDLNNNVTQCSSMEECRRHAG